MNHTLRFSLVLLVGVATTLSAQAGNRWEIFQSMDWTARQEFLHSTPNPGWDEDFLTKALDLADSSQIETGDDNTVALKKGVAIRVMQLLAGLPAPKAAPGVARIARQYHDPILRGESWVASARLGDPSVVPGVVVALEGFNDSGLRSRNEEIQAAYAVQALGILRAPAAFRAVIAASVSWYSPASSVRPLAQKTLPLLVPDVAKATVDLLANDDDLTLKEGVFQGVLDQGDPAFAAQAASALLTAIVHDQPQDKDDQDRAVRVTLAALVAAEKAPSPPATLVPSLKVLLSSSKDPDVLLRGVRLTAKIDDPSAVDLLASTLTRYNNRQKTRTNTGADLALVKQLFQALGASGKAAARAVLNEARYSDYSPAMVKDAEDALAKLPQ